VRLVDPRLLRRSQPVRALLALDTAIGLATAALVLAQAVLIARIAARSFAGASFAELRTDLVLLVGVVTARAATVWAFEVVGRRAATSVLSGLRRELVARSVGDRPATHDRTGSAELATLAVGGVDALETVFARTLPAAVNAVVVPVAVLVFVASVDLVAAGVMLLTLPLVPLFMWLLGRHAARRTRERWAALARLATHFLDVVRGLPTLRAFGRSRVQAERIGAVSEEYRRATMSTLRVAFLSTAVLELAATLGIALVAVTVGVRLVDGGIGFEAALTVLVLTPELYHP
jgi:ABC-type transport system involved in cytochrome bd biosynthesis fused ATPase/permease subunit